MSDRLVFDIEGAISLHGAYQRAVDDVLRDRSVLVDQLSDAAALLGHPVVDVSLPLGRVADHLRDEADSLRERVALVARGGADLNACLWAVERVATHFTTIETQGGADSRDGRLSRDDLEWAAETLRGDTAAAARWLLEHDDWFTLLETARDNDGYLASPGGIPGHPGDGDGLVSVADLDAFVTLTTTRATVAPYLPLIDTAAEGGEPDAFHSRADFESFLRGYDLPPDVRRAIQQVLDDGAYDRDGTIGLGTMLDATSFVPVIGDLVDGARALYFAAQGDWAEAALYGLGVLPIPGLSASGLKGARSVAESVATAAARGGRREATREVTDQTVRHVVATHTGNVVVDELYDSDNRYLDQGLRVLGGDMAAEGLSRVAR